MLAYCCLRRIIMDLLYEILARIIEQEAAKTMSSDLRIRALEMVDMQCYWTLKKIKAIIEDESLDDPECFLRVEAIINAIEDVGVACGARHDFG